MRIVVSPIRVADDILEIAAESPQIAQSLAEKIRTLDIADEVVPGLTSVSLQLAPDQIDGAMTALRYIEDIEVDALDAQPLFAIPVHYGGEHGPDLESICELLGMTRDAFISIHTTALHSVDMIGFTPGFAYISGLPKSFSIPRLSSPRPRVPAGSIGLSTAHTGIYSMSGPGGWPLIGRTTLSLFEPNANPPLLLQPGQTVRFKSI